MARLDNKFKIGLLGGTFDPIHFGHLRTALDVVEYLDLDQLRFIPCAQPPHRQQPVASPAARRTMAELAIKNHPKLVVDDREIHREGPSYSVDTLLSLRQDFPDNPLYLLMGTDTFKTLPSWSRWEMIFDLAHVVVMQRPNEPIHLEGELAKVYHARLAGPDDIDTQAGKIWLVPVTQLAISATSIRSALAQQRDIRYLLPDAVISLIEQLKLYS